MMIQAFRYLRPEAVLISPSGTGVHLCLCVHTQARTHANRQKLMKMQQPAYTHGCKHACMQARTQACMQAQTHTGMVRLDDLVVFKHNSVFILFIKIAGKETLDDIEQEYPL